VALALALIQSKVAQTRLLGLRFFQSKGESALSAQAAELKSRSALPELFGKLSQVGFAH
jgi:hypothetical protein